MKQFLIGVFFLKNIIALSQSADSSYLIKIPVFYFPFQKNVIKTYHNYFDLPINPSMNQSLYWSNSFYSLSHYYLSKYVKKDKIKELSILTFDILTFYTPLGLAWLHEEYHRAVLTKYNAKSFNDIYKFPFFKSFVSVSHVADEDLVRIANNYKADFIRLNSAGIESQIMQVKTLQQSNFYSLKPINFITIYLYNILNTSLYIMSCSKVSSDKLVNDMIKEEGSNIEIRDITGLDFTAWVDALYNPDKPYEARGIHPSGVGYNRYIKVADLSSDEKNYLKKQAYLSLLNLIAPSIYGINKIEWKNFGKFNFAFRHFLTPFGNNVSIDFFFKKESMNIYIAIHTYSNKNKTFPGLEYSIFDYPIFQKKLNLAFSNNIWIQPYSMSFYDNKGKLGTAISLCLSSNSGKLMPYIEAEYKTKGWLPANVYLEENYSINAGLKMKIN